MLNGKQVYAVIGAAGSGTRMGAAVPKQFLKIEGKTILERTVSVFLEEEHVDRIVIVTSAEWLTFTESLFDDERNDKLTVVCGGEQRQDSVGKGLQALRRFGAEDDSLVLVHDGVRPYVSGELIRSVALAAEKTGAAVPAVAPKDTIRQRLGGTLDRNSLCCVQTPQAFRFDLIESAYQSASEDGFYGTDDAGLVERLGLPVAVVEGDYRNIKITTPEDLRMEQRIGTGFDVHRLETGQKLILGGVCIPFEKGLLGHSDADVLVHALMDAMLGAAALGDIGGLFPDSDPAYRGISSILLLKKVNEAVLAEGYSLGNADVTVICQQPKLAPYIGQMRGNIAEALGVPKEKISIKATTTEKLGFTGRGEGIAAEAVCILNR